MGDDVTLVTAAELMERRLLPPRFIVPGLIPEGLTVLAARPKTGKSWLALGASLAVANGSQFMGLPVEQGEALYLGIEDTPQRLRARLQTLCKVDRPTDALHLACSWPLLGEGGLDQLERWISDHRRTRLVVLDTLGRLAGAGGGSYAKEYARLAEIKGIADRRRVAVLVISHLRKAGSGNWTDAIMGSSAVVGAADCIIGLNRGRNEGEAVLAVTGRDVEEQEVAVRFDSNTGRWSILGDAREQFLSDGRQAIIAVLKASHVPVGAKVVADKLGVNPNTTRKTMGTMARQGFLMRVAGGYVAASKPRKAKATQSYSGTEGSAGSPGSRASKETATSKLGATAAPTTPGRDGAQIVNIADFLKLRIPDGPAN